MPQYATIAQYQTFAGLPLVTPTDEEIARLNALLVQASYRVRKALLFARIAYGPDELAKSSTIAADIANATSATVQMMEELGDSTGVAQDFDSASLIGVTFAKRASGEAITLAQKTGVSPVGADILMSIPGVWSTSVRTRY